MQLNKTEFDQWLRANPDREFHKGSACNCPIASYLTATTERIWSVGCSTYSPLSGDYTFDYELPMWARIFISRYDRNPDFSAIQALESINES